MVLAHFKLMTGVSFRFCIHSIIIARKDVAVKAQGEAALKVIVSLRFDTAGDYGYVGSKYTSNAHVLRGNHLQAHVAVRELTTQIGIVSRTHHYAAILRFVLLILSSL